MAEKQGYRGRKGDRVVVEGRKVGTSPRSGTIVAVLGEPGRERWEVAWDDGRTTVFAPSSDARVEPAGKRASGAKAARTAGKPAAKKSAARSSGGKRG